MMINVALIWRLSPNVPMNVALIESCEAKTLLRLPRLMSVRVGRAVVTQVFCVCVCVSVCVCVLCLRVGGFFVCFFFSLFSRKRPLFFPSIIDGPFSSLSCKQYPRWTPPTAGHRQRETER